jgi:hypothetical protein
MIKVVPFEMEHLEQLLPKLREHDAMVVRLHGGFGSMHRLFGKLEKCAIINSFMCEDEVVAIWVFLQKWPGVAQCSAWTGTAVERMPKEFWKACVRGLESAQEAIGLHRLEAHVRADHPHGFKWLQKLGFEVEGIMKQHEVDKVDAYMLGRIW